jgi:hypothetical protein
MAENKVVTLSDDQKKKIQTKFSDLTFLEFLSTKVEEKSGLDTSTGLRTNGLSIS